MYFVEAIKMIEGVWLKTMAQLAVKQTAPEKKR